MKKWYFLSPLILQKLIWIPTRFILFIFGRIEIRGLDNLKNLNNNVIFAPNHSSEFDVFMIPGSLGFFSPFSPIFYTSREKEFYKNAGWRQIFYGGAFFKAWGAYPVATGLKDYQLSMINLTKIMNDGGNLVLFPEGGTTKDGNLRPAKRGVIYLAHTTARPIVPVYLSGTFRLSLVSLITRRKKLGIVFGKPVYIKPQPGTVLSIDDYKTHADSLMVTIENLKNSLATISPTPPATPLVQ